MGTYKEESESAAETMKAGTGGTLSPVLWEACCKKGVIPGTGGRTLTGSDHGVASAPSQRV